MDDPLSAVDAHVGKHLFENAIQGYLKGKTIVLITNQLQYLPQADQIVVLSAGKQVDCGPFITLMERCEEMQNIMKEYGAIDHHKEQEEDQEDLEKKKALLSKKPSALSKKKSSKKLTQVEDKATGLVGIGIYWYLISSLYPNPNPGTT
jgi:ATP-binding cassette, subfamily C (CFTR/MRP), member 1